MEVGYYFFDFLKVTMILVILNTVLLTEYNTNMQKCMNLIAAVS